MYILRAHFVLFSYQASQLKHGNGVWAWQIWHLTCITAWLNRQETSEFNVKSKIITWRKKDNLPIHYSRGVTCEGPNLSLDWSLLKYYYFFCHVASGPEFHPLRWISGKSQIWTSAPAYYNVPNNWVMFNYSYLIALGIESSNQT
jgi:hypothetical protein